MSLTNPAVDNSRKLVWIIKPILKEYDLSKTKIQGIIDRTVKATNEYYEKRDELIILNKQLKKTKEDRTNQIMDLKNELGRWDYIIANTNDVKTLSNLKLYHDTIYKFQNTIAPADTIQHIITKVTSHQMSHTDANTIIMKVR